MTNTRMRRNTINYGNYQAYFLIISPAMAKEMLLKNKGNRRIDENRVNKYIADMQNGYWCFNGDSIRFDITGNLIDGQHRLTAVTRGEESYLFLIVENVDDESKRTIDTNKNRTGADVLAMFAGAAPGEAAAIAGAITKLILYKNGLLLTGGGSYLGMTTNACIEEFYKQNHQQLHNSLNFITEHIDRHAMVLSRSEALFLHYIFSEIHLIDADVFMKKLLTGVDITLPSNEYLLRNTLLKRSMKTLKIQPAHALYSCIKAWNRTRKGGVYSSEGNLRYNQNDIGYPVAK